MPQEWPVGVRRLGGMAQIRMILLMISQAGLRLRPRAKPATTSAPGLASVRAGARAPQKKRITPNSAGLPEQTKASGEFGQHVQRSRAVCHPPACPLEEKNRTMPCDAASGI